MGFGLGLWSLGVEVEAVLQGFRGTIEVLQGSDQGEKPQTVVWHLKANGPLNPQALLL